MCYVLYNSDNDIISYYDDIEEVCFKLKYEKKEISRKFKNSLLDYITLHIENKTYFLYKFL